MERNFHYSRMSKIQEFMIAVSSESGNSGCDAIIRNMDKLGMEQAVLYLFEEPVKYDFSKGDAYPENIRLKCVMRRSGLYILPEERQSCLLSEIFIRKELSLKCKGYAVFSVFYGDQLYGIMMSELDDNIYDSGEFIAQQLARAIYIARICNNNQKTAGNKESK